MKPIILNQILFLFHMREIEYFMGHIDKTSNNVLFKYFHKKWLNINLFKYIESNLAGADLTYLSNKTYRCFMLIG